MQRHKSKVFKCFKMYSLLTVLVFFLFAEIAYSVYENMQERNIQDELNTMSHNYAGRIQENLLRKVYVVETLEVMLRLTSFEETLFYRWAPTIYNSEPGIGAVQLAPDGIVEHIYPLEGNEGALGHDLLKDKDRDDGARKTIESEAITFVGPLRLIQNNKLAVISRKPVFQYVEREKKFWGFTIVLIYIEDILTEELSNIKESGYIYRILGDDPDAAEAPILTACKLDTCFHEYESTYPIIVPGGKWVFQMGRLEKQNYVFVHVIFLLIAALLAGIYIHQHYRMIRQSAEIERLNVEFKRLSYMDDLTQSKNRRGVEKYLEQITTESIRENKPLTIAMIDIDHFKQVNDTYGHGVGDLVIQYVSTMIRDHFCEDHIMGRLGGDEFVCVFNEHTFVEIRRDAETLCNHMRKSPYVYNNQSIPVTLSIGIAQYQGDDIEVFLDRADKALYRAKANGRDQVSYKP